jgi:hypothetical protein
MKFLLTNAKSNNFGIELSETDIGSTHSSLKLLSDKPLLDWKSQGNRFIAFGNVIGVRNSAGAVDSSTSSESLRSALENPSKLRDVEGRFIILQFSVDGRIDIWTDQFGRVDVYYQQVDNEIFVSSGLDLLPVSKGIHSEIDNVGMMQAAYIYGGRPAKKHTWYKHVSRVGVSEVLTWSVNDKLTLTDIAKPDVKRSLYIEPDSLNDYSVTFIESIRARASVNGNVVFLSSGWDSTSILATLVHLFGKSKTRAVIGRMKYSERSGICNTFEMERAKKIADYFGVRLDIVDLDYRSGARELKEKLNNSYRSQQFTNLTGWNHWILAEYAASTSNGGEVVFAGEMSDGAHNFGFSQYASIFHPNSYDFREYSDKMATYLFGPTFLDVLLKNGQNEDPVWNLFKSTKSDDFFEPLAESESQIKKQFLTSFFLRSGRMPLAKNNSKLLSKLGKQELDDVSFKTYLEKSSQNLTGDNLYSTYLDLYNSFHWQGSTVSTLDHALEAHNMGSALPFHDSKLIEFLSNMPESWGRGLELKPTKYPLKWMLANKIDYPMEMQSGAHSYTYDVDPNFTHIGELINHSSLGDVFKEALREGGYQKILSQEHFNHEYIDGLVSKYCAGEEILGAEQADLLNVAMQSTLGPQAD